MLQHFDISALKRELSFQGNLPKGISAAFKQRATNLHRIILRKLPRTGLEFAVYKNSLSLMATKSQLEPQVNPC